METVLTALSAHFIGRPIPRPWPTACPTAMDGPVSGVPPVTACTRVWRVERCSPLRRKVRLALWSASVLAPPTRRTPNRCRRASAVGAPRQCRLATPRLLWRQRCVPRRRPRAAVTPAARGRHQERPATVSRTADTPPLQPARTSTYSPYPRMQLFLLQRKQDVSGSPRLG